MTRNRLFAIVLGIALGLFIHELGLNIDNFMFWIILVFGAIIFSKIYHKLN